jgi:Fur family transcriptional regulator, zinc uptake regulator
MTAHIHNHTALTKNQALVFSELSKADGPLSAYTILDQLRDEGFRAPLQVYRALDKLVEFGLVHRLESLNAFVACSHKDCQAHSAAAFAICEKCGQVNEISDAGLDDRLRELADAAGFSLTRSVVEMRGLCSACRAAA